MGPAAAGGAFVASPFPCSPLGCTGLLQTCSSNGVRQSDPVMPCNRCCSCYSFYLDFPACFDGESCFILRAVLQSHGQERNNHEFQSRTTTLELFPYIPWKPPLTLMIIPPFAEVFGKHKGRRKQLGSLAGWALLSFPHTGEDHHKEVSSAEVLH